MSRALRHPHKYYRTKLPNGPIVWACALDSCNHHMPAHYEPMLLGKQFHCWECGNIDTLKEDHLKIDPKYFISEDKFPSRPRCIQCVLGKFDEADITAILEQLGKDK